MVVVLMIDMLVALVVLAALVQRNRYLSRKNFRMEKA
jgi:hypothetical protein